MLSHSFNILLILIPAVFGNISGIETPQIFTGCNQRLVSSILRAIRISVQLVGNPMVFTGTSDIDGLVASTAFFYIYIYIYAILLLPSNSAATGPGTTYRAILVILTIMFTFVTYVALQAILVGLRALVTDDYMPLQQAKSNAWAGRHINLAAVLGYLADYVDFPRSQFGNTTFAGTSVLTLFYLVAAITITCFCTPEKIFKGPSPQISCESKSSKLASFQELWSTFLRTSRQIKLICLVQFFAWFGWFPFLFYTVPYVACRPYF